MICLTLGCSLFSNFVTSRQFVYEKLEKQSLWSFWKGRDSKFCWRRLERKPNRFFRRKSQFTRGCLRETRMNPGQFVDRMRVEAAQQMIDSSAMGLKEIANPCGFQTPLAMR